MFVIRDLQTKNRTRHTENRTPRTPASVYLSYGTKKTPAVPEISDMMSEMIESSLKALHFRSPLILRRLACVFDACVILNSSVIISTAFRKTC